jgi:hypothetical protein
MSDRQCFGLDAARIADRATESGAQTPDFLVGYIEMLVAVSKTGRRLGHDELDTRRVLGAAAAEQNVTLRALIDLYLGATWLTWRELPTVAGGKRRDRPRHRQCIRGDDRQPPPVSGTSGTSAVGRLDSNWPSSPTLGMSTDNTTAAAVSATIATRGAGTIVVSFGRNTINTKPTTTNG